MNNIFPVSYTHLDVYKRQVYGRALPSQFDGCGQLGGYDPENGGSPGT